jgi:uncharacterized membrane protein
MQPTPKAFASSLADWPSVKAIGLIAATSALVGAGVGLLVAGRLSEERRRMIGGFLAGIGIVAYLDVWQRNIIAVEDPCLSEVALGGPDTKPRS